MRTLAIWFSLFAAVTAGERQTITFPDSPSADVERTCFQAASPWRPEFDIRSDVAIVYGVNSSTRERIARYKSRGYRIHLMTGVAWGGYADYFEGRFDGAPHMKSEGQKNRQGDTLWHGGRPPIPYVMPSRGYTEYLKSLLKQAVDAGVDAIHMEEPEFWVNAGYSQAFKDEWQKYYGEPWQPPHSSPDARYRCAKLKYHLYYRTLATLFKYIKEISNGRVACYVPTHSLVNYAHWRIVSPESSLMNLPEADGYTAQVWTGTARTPNRYQGVVKERTFETALVEYGQMMSMVRPTGRRTYFLADPVEDNPRHGWDDYQVNYECTLIASLFYPSVYHYEVMPWPNRVFLGTYPRQDPRRPGADQTRVRMPGPYATELLTLINVLNDMKQTDIQRETGMRGIGCLLSDTMMFQRGTPSPSDPHMSSLYGLVLPLIKHGTLVEPVQLETILTPAALASTSVLLLTYEHQKPMKPEYHEVLARWVGDGGVLVVVDDEQDPYNQVREWWNDKGLQFKTPLEHLRVTLGLPREERDLRQPVGKGYFLQLSRSPRELSKSAAGADVVRSLIKEALSLQGSGEEYTEKNYLQLRRGPYIITSVLDESVSESPLEINGHFIDLFDPLHRVAEQISVSPGQRSLLLDINRTGKRPRVAASASRITGFTAKNDGVTFISRGPSGTDCTTSCLLTKQPTEVLVNGVAAKELLFTPDDGGGILRIQYANDPEGVQVAIRW